MDVSVGAYILAARLVVPPYCCCVSATGGLLSDLLLPMRYDAKESCFGEGAELVK